MNQSTLDKIRKQNLHLLRVIENYSEEKKQEIWAGLIANYKEKEKLRNKYDHEAHRRARLQKQKERDSATVKCPMCDCTLKYSSLTKHKNNNKCKLNKLLKKELTNEINKSQE